MRMFLFSLRDGAANARLQYRFGPRTASTGWAFAAAHPHQPQAFFAYGHDHPYTNRPHSVHGLAGYTGPYSRGDSSTWKKEENEETLAGSCQGPVAPKEFRPLGGRSAKLKDTTLKRENEKIECGRTRRKIEKRNDS